jgi:membrane-associated protease RseP (regulator of RpoE activity)
MSSQYLKRSWVVFLVALAFSGLASAPVFAGGSVKEDQSIDLDDDPIYRNADSSGRNSRDSDRGYLGVSVQRLRHSLKEAFDIPDDVDGLLVSKVYDGSPADRAGIEEKDVVTRFNGKRVDNEDDFTRMIRDSRPGSQATIEVWRDGRSRELRATLASVRGEARQSWSWSNDDDDDNDRTPMMPTPPTPPTAPRARLFNFSNSDHGHMGVYLQDLNKDIAGYFSMSDDRGALIWQVIEDSPADEAGLKAGDVVTRVEDKDVRDSQDLREMLADHEAGETVSITYMRRGQSETTEVKLNEGEQEGYVLGETPGLEALRNLQRGRDLQLNRRSDRDTSRSMERLQREMEQLQNRMNQLKEDLERLKD